MLPNADPYGTDLPPDELQIAVTARRLRYTKAGYSPLPCAGKRPVAAEWQNISVDLDAIESWRGS
jgi:hypothetical protein